MVVKVDIEKEIIGEWSGSDGKSSVNVSFTNGGKVSAWNKWSGSWKKKSETEVTVSLPDGKYDFYTDDNFKSIKFKNKFGNIFVCKKK